jgi:F0F1-type ATP synthase assembly protein I
MTDEPGKAQRPRIPDSSRRQGVSGAEFAGVGLQFALTIVVFMFAGIWLDRTLHTSPWFVLVCVFVGAAAGFFSIYRKLTSAQRRTDHHH